MKPHFRKAVFIVTYRKTKNIFGKTKIKYLLLKRKLHWKGWEFPKGGIKNKDFKRKLKPKETFGVLGAVKREVKEETGQFPFSIKKYNFSGKYKYDKIYPGRKGIIGQTYKLFSAEIKNKKIKLDKLEHSSYRWLDFNKAIKLLTHKNQKKSLKIANKNLKV